MQNSIAKKLFAGLSTVAVAASGFAPLVASAATHPVGTNISSTDGTVWLITNNNCKRAYTSAGAFLSYGFNSFSNVVPANSDDMALATCPEGFIPPQDGKVIISDRGGDKNTAYFISQGMKRGFTSQAVFKGLGYSFTRAQKGDVSFLPTGANLDSASMQHPVGTLINYNGEVRLVGLNGYLGIPSVSVFQSWGYSFADVVKSNSSDMTLTNVGVMPTRDASKAELSPSFNVTPTPPVTPPGTGTTVNASVSVAPATDMPASASVPKSATNVVFNKFVVNNTGSSDASINSITVTRTGSGNPSDFENVYVYNGDTRVTTGRTINTSTNSATFSGISIAVPANGSVTLSILASIATTATGSNQHALNVYSVGVTGGTATGSSMGNSMTITGASAGTLTIQKSGTISNPKIAETQAKIAEFQLQAGSEEDLTVKRITLYYTGSMNQSYISNLKLRSSGTDISTASAITSRGYLVFPVNMEMARGLTKTFQVHGDISGSAKVTENIKIYLEEASDIFAVGKTYGTGARTNINTNYDGSSCAASTDDCSYSQIDGAKITMNRMGSSKDTSPNQQDAELLSFDFTSANNIELRKITLTVTNSAGNLCADLNSNGLCESSLDTPYLKDVKIWDTSSNTVVFGPKDISVSSASDTTQTLQFTDVLSLTSGTKKSFKVTGDLASYTAGATETLRVDVTAFGSSDIKNTDNNTFVTTSDIVPNGFQGFANNIRQSSLVVSQAGSPAAQTYINGKQDASLGAFTFQAGNGRDVTVRSVKVTATGVGTCATNPGTCIIALKLMDGTTQLGQSQTLTSAAPFTATFNNLTFAVPKGAAKTLSVVGQISGSASNASTGNTVLFSVATVASDVVAEDPDGNAVSPSGTAAGINMTIAPSGTLSVVAAASEQEITDSHIIVANKTNVTVSKFRFTANNEDVNVTQLSIKLYTGSSTPATASATEEVAKVRLFDGTTEIGSGITPNGSGVAKFISSGDKLFTVSKNSSKTLTVAVDLNSVKNTGATSGNSFNAKIEGLDNTTSAFFEAKGVDSGNTLTGFGSLSPDLTATGTSVAAVGTMTVRNSKPTFTLIANSSTTKLGNGTNIIYKFRVAADSNDQVSLSRISFNIAATTAIAGNTFIRKSGTSQALTNITTGVGEKAFTFTSEEQISAGASSDYELVVDVTGVNTGASVSATMLAENAGGSITDTQANMLATAARMVWSDWSATVHSSSSADFTNGWVLKVPSDTSSLGAN